MWTVRDLLKSKGSEVFSIAPQASTLVALNIMAEKNVGALVVVQDGKLEGIISERDFARRISAEGQCGLERPVSDSMTRHVYTIHPDQNIEDCMALMTQHKIRHLPVEENDRLVGLISIGDVVKAIIDEQHGLIQQLENYIGGKR